MSVSFPLRFEFREVGGYRGGLCESGEVVDVRTVRRRDDTGDVMRMLDGSIDDKDANNRA